MCEKRTETACQGLHTLAALLISTESSVSSQLNSWMSSGSFGAVSAPTGFSLAMPSANLEALARYECLCNFNVAYSNDAPEDPVEVLHRAV